MPQGYAAVETYPDEPPVYTYTYGWEKNLVFNAFLISIRRFFLFPSKMFTITEFLTTTPRITTGRLRAGTATTPRESTSSTCPTGVCRRWPTPCPGTPGMSRTWSTPERLSTRLSLPADTRADDRWREAVMTRWGWQDPFQYYCVLEITEYLINCWKDLV